MTFSDRLPLLLVSVAIVLACDSVLCARDGFGLDALEPPDAESRRGVRTFRILNGLVGIAAIAFLVARSHPGWAFAATAFHALVAPGLVLVGSAIRARRQADPALPGPRWVETRFPLTTGGVIGWPLQLLHLALIVVVVLFFRWTLRFMPSVAPVHWSAEGRVFTSPTRLWWSLGIVALNTTMLLFTAWAARGPGVAPEGAAEPEHAKALDVQRRVLSVRLVEALMVGLNGVALVMWVAAVVAMLPGQSGRLVAQGAVVAAALAVLVLVVSIGLYMPAIVRARRAIANLDASAADQSPTAK